MKGSLSRFGFWLFAWAFAAFVLSAPAFAGSDTCASAGQVIAEEPVTGTVFTVVGSGDAWADVELYFDDVFQGSAASFSAESSSGGAAEIELKCGASTGSAEWTFAFSTPSSCPGACTTDDVVAGLGQLSEQFHGFAAFVVVALVVGYFFAALFGVLAFRMFRRG